MPKRKRKNKLPYLIILVILVSVFVTMAIQARNKEDDEGGDTGSYTSIEQDDDEEEVNKKEISEESNEGSADVVEKKAVQYDGGSPNESESLTGAINYASVNGDKFLIRVSIDQYLEEGTCELVLMQGGEVVYHEATDIMGDATASTCMGFDVPMTSLSGGETQFTVYLDSGGRVGEISGGIEL